jgi:hypothetical protein
VSEAQRILVVDDTPLNVKLLADLRHEGPGQPLRPSSETAGSIRMRVERQAAAPCTEFDMRPRWGANPTV